MMQEQHGFCEGEEKGSLSTDFSGQKDKLISKNDDSDTFVKST
jgi:hypothetical protein